MTSREKQSVCCVKGCHSRQGDDGVTHFSFPVDMKRRMAWLRVIGRPDITAFINLKSNIHVVCSNHFEDHQMTTMKQTLPDALPTRKIPRVIKGVLKTLSSTQTQTDFSTDDSTNTIDSDDTNDDSDDETVKNKECGNDQAASESRSSKNCDENDDLISDFNYYSDEIFDTDSESRCIKRKHCDDFGNKSKISKNDTGNDLTVDESVKKPSIDYVVWNKFFEWKDRTTNRRKGQKFNEDFNMFALNLHTINSRGYKLLMATWELPSEKELKEIDLSIRPRLDDRVMSLLIQKFKLLSREGSYCTLGLQTVALKNDFYYDAVNDDLIGVHNDNGVRTNEAASYALVAMVRGIAVEWCQPLAYVLISETGSEIIHEFVSYLLGKLKATNLKVMSIVMPNNPTFYKYYNEKCFNQNKLYIRVCGEMLHAAFDLPHLLNSFRTEFITCDFGYEGKIVSWKYIKQAYEINKGNRGKLLMKLTDGHLQLDQSEKGLMYPRQVFSQSVAAAISFYVDHGSIVEQARPTADFLSTLSNILDILNLNNSKVLRENPCKSSGAQIKTIEDFCIFIKSLKATKDGEDVTQNISSLQCLHMTLKSFLSLYEELKNENNIFLKSARCLYLGSLRRFVHSLQQVKEDENGEELTPVQFTRRFSKLFVKYLVELTPPLASMGNLAEFLQMADNFKYLQGNIKERIILQDTDYEFDLPDVEALTYVASYLLYKVSKAHECNEFNKYFTDLIDLNKTKMNDHFEELNPEAEFRKRLKCPTDSFIEYIEKLDACFIAKFDLFHRTYPAIKLLDALKYVPPWEEHCTSFPAEYLLKLFVRMRIYQTLVYNNQCLKERLAAPAVYKLKVKKL